ncbi:MAG: ABC transporter permease [bacterium]
MATEPQTNGWQERVLAPIGEPMLEVYEIVRGIASTFMLTIYYTLNRKKRREAIAEQLFEIGNKSVMFIAFTLGFLGMILIYQAGYQAMRITGDLQMLGALFLQLLLRVFAPTITAMMLATRVGSGIAAQIGSMVVTEQVDALKMCAAQPIQYLVVPRFIASTIMSVVLTIFAVLVAYVAGAIVANTAFNVNFYTFWNLSFIGWFDVIICLTKAVAYGMAIPVIACQAGLVVTGGSEGVGRGHRPQWCTAVWPS